MLAKLYNQLPEYHRSDVLEAAIKGHKHRHAHMLHNSTDCIRWRVPFRGH